MVTVDTRPQTFDILGYGGDTLTIRVQAPASLVEGKEWHAQIRPAKGSDSLDAIFTIIPPGAPEGTAATAYLVLSSEDSARLIGNAPVMRRTRLASGELYAIHQYAGVWDCQVSGVGGADPVRTLVQGTLTLDMDVTRLVLP